MSDSYSKYHEDLQEYIYLCKLLNEEKIPEDKDWYQHFFDLKKSKLIEYKDYRYQLKS